MSYKTNKKTILIITVIAAILTTIVSTVIFTRIAQNNSKVLDSYVACGCGVCGGSESKLKLKYYSKSQGKEEEYNRAVHEDKETAESYLCAVSGCSIGSCTKLILTE